MTESPAATSGSRSTLRAGVHLIYLPALLYAQAWAEVKTERATSLINPGVPEVFLRA